MTSPSRDALLLEQEIAAVCDAVYRARTARAHIEMHNKLSDDDLAHLDEVDRHLLYVSDYAYAAAGELERITWINDEEVEE